MNSFEEEDEESTTKSSTIITKDKKSDDEEEINLKTSSSLLGGGAAVDKEKDGGKRRKKKKKSSEKEYEASYDSASNPIVNLLPASSSSFSLIAKVKEILERFKLFLLTTIATHSANPKLMFKRVVLLAWASVVFMALASAFGLSTPNLFSREIIKEDLRATPSPTEEEIIVQKLLPHKSTKVNVAFERDFGCREIQCVAACNGKAKPKCLKSRSCVSERNKICEKRCRKARCEDRCKDEPHLGYVEREQGLEKCKEGCVGPTATHNKCVVKCHVKYKPCKTKCFESANKFKCDKPQILALLNPAAGGSSTTSSSSSTSKGAEENELDDEGGEVEKKPVASAADEEDLL